MITILPLEPDALGYIYRLRLDQWEHLRTPHVLSAGDLTAWLRSPPADAHFVALYRDDARSIMYERSRGNPVQPTAVGGFTGIDTWNRSAEVWFLTDQGGYEVAALEALRDYGFDRFGFHRLWAEAYTEERAALFEKVGFTVEGKRRAALHRSGRWHDTVCLSMLAPERQPAAE